MYQFLYREQFPKPIEEKRKALYPVAKDARKNTNNKVRLIRDRLYINNEEIIIETGKNSEKSAPSAKQRSKNFESNATKRNPWQNTKSDRTSYRGERVFYRGRGAKQSYIPKNAGPKTVDFSLPVSNPFGPLIQLDQTPMRPNCGNINGTSSSKKHPASSPLDDENTTKRQRDDLIIQASDVDSESDESDMAVSPCRNQTEEKSNDPSTHQKSVDHISTVSESQIDAKETIPDDPLATLLKPDIVAALSASSLKDGDPSQAGAGTNEPPTNSPANDANEAVSETA